ncbi:hypothetical protein BDQ12DRAFT_666669 [Crucibulum laeve]|uniref:Uncharacterized protein n=1 Tax=Crucibulum laeve TaxID=68775 RepID=A0A5C3LYJ1_9AGAR|nr:hypothetical protein BDQ12DRAFT_666669 [Crucibulum laeve]
MQAIVRAGTGTIVRILGGGDWMTQKPGPENSPDTMAFGDVGARMTLCGSSPPLLLLFPSLATYYPNLWTQHLSTLPPLHGTPLFYESRSVQHSPRSVKDSFTNSRTSGCDYLPKLHACTRAARTSTLAKIYENHLCFIIEHWLVYGILASRKAPEYVHCKGFLIRWPYVPGV